MKNKLAVLLALSVLAWCQTQHSSAAVTKPAEGITSSCRQPAQITTLYQQDGAVLEVWSLSLAEVENDSLPDEPAFVEYRNAIKQQGADSRQPELVVPAELGAAEAAIWQAEQFNNALVFNGKVGAIEAISCLDALLFARQASRVPQLQRPTEFIASVLRRDTNAGVGLAVVFGGGSELFPPKAVYGFDVVDLFVADGWRYWYMLHNHTVQRSGENLVLGVPAPGTSDIQFARGLGNSYGLEAIRVTNGFYTFSASVEDLAPLQGASAR